MKLHQLIFSFIVLLIGCEDHSKDVCIRQVYEYKPVYKDLSDIRTIEFQSPREIENPGKIYVYDRYLMVNEIDKGIHIIDNSNQSNPKPIGFYAIEGNRDLAVKNDVLYADNYVDLLSIDISNIENPQLKHIEELVYEHPFYRDEKSKKLITHYEVQSVKLEDCGLDFAFISSADALAQSSSGGFSTNPNLVGQSGSMARFTLMNNHLYLIDGNRLHSFNITDKLNPEPTGTKDVGWGIETIFPYNNSLFIGARNGMHIFDAQDPSNPTFASTFNHVESCDPVIVDNDLAYVTLRGGTDFCGNRANQLLKLDVADIYSPRLIKEMDMTNPHGLGILENHLFICDGNAGIRVFHKNELNTMSESTIAHITEVFGKDIILLSNKTAIVLTDKGYEQYDVSNIHQIKKLSTIRVQ